MDLALTFVAAAGAGEAVELDDLYGRCCAGEGVGQGREKMFLVVRQIGGRVLGLGSRTGLPLAMHGVCEEGVRARLLVSA